MFKNKNLEASGKSLKSNFGVGRNQGSKAFAKHMQKASTEKDIRSAMVRLNTQGLNVPVKLDELKKLPNIAQPYTGAKIQKKNLTDLGPGANCLSLNEALEEEEDSECYSKQRALQNRRESVARSKYNSTHLSNTIEEDTTTIFDLVHRDRQRQQQHREIQKQSKERQVHSPKILSPMCVHSKGKGYAFESTRLNAAGIMQNSSQNYLLGRKHLSNSHYRSVSGSNKHKH